MLRGRESEAVGVNVAAAGSKISVLLRSWVPPYPAVTTSYFKTLRKTIIKQAI